MGIVTEYLIGMIKRQLDERRLVVWFDPDKHYFEVFQNLSIPDVQTFAYKDSFFKLRKEYDSLLNDLSLDAPPKMVVYVPLKESDTHHALAELTASGIILEPGRHPWQLNTKLSGIAGRALKDVLPDDDIKIIQKQLDDGKWRLAELDKYAEKMSGKTPGLIDAIFDTKQPLEVALKFLNAEIYDSKIKEKDALNDLIALFEAEYGVEISGKNAKKVRENLARIVFVTDFIESINTEIPKKLKTIKIPESKVHRESCSNIASTWRLRTDYHESYLKHSSVIEKEVGIGEISLSISEVGASETFKITDESLQEQIEEQMILDVTTNILGVVDKRKSMFWAKSDPNLASRWELIYLCAQLFKYSELVKDGIKKMSSLEEVISRYVDGEEPLCLMDTSHRRMENTLYLYHISITQTCPDSLSRLITKARSVYMEVGGLLTRAFVDIVQESEFELKRTVSQTQIYNNEVIPALRSGKTAYVLVDAMRYEMARELANRLHDDFTVNLAHAFGMLPSITPIGMAALMPGANKSFSIKQGTKLEPYIEGNRLIDRNSRIAWLRGNPGDNKKRKKSEVLDLKIEEMLNLTPQLKERVKEADLILVTSEELDSLCETGKKTLARSTMDNLLQLITRTVHNLAIEGCQTIILTADHGYLFGEKMETDMKIPSPGGKVIELHHRAWVGVGGKKDTAFSRLKPLYLEIDDAELLVPRGFGIFKCPGQPKEYFHGGLSLQEIIIPVIHLEPSKAGTVRGQAIKWEFDLIKQEITTRVVTVYIAGHSTSIELNPPKVRVEIRDEDGPISEAYMATYGFDQETKEIQLEEDKDLKILRNDVSLVIFRETKARNVSVILIDTKTGSTLATLEGVKIKLDI